jgi:hypothetical protein
VRECLGRQERTISKGVASNAFGAILLKGCAVGSSFGAQTAPHLLRVETHLKTTGDKDMHPLIVATSVIPLVLMIATPGWPRAHAKLFNACTQLIDAESAAGGSQFGSTCVGKSNGDVVEFRTGEVRRGWAILDEIQTLEAKAVGETDSVNISNP